MDHVQRSERIRIQQLDVSTLRPTGASMQNVRGKWVPAIPLPFFRGRPWRRFQCGCGERFRTQQRYREHYALAHILEIP